MMAEPPEKAQFSTATMLGRMIHCPAPQEQTAFETEPEYNETPTTYANLTAGLPSHVTPLLGNFSEQEIDPLFWIEELNKGSLTNVTDGSVKDGKGSYAVILKAGNQTLQFQGPVFCHLNLIASYQAELSGILALHYLLLTFVSFAGRPITEPTLLYCDNKAAVAASSEAATWPRMTTQLALDIDLITEIRNLKSCLLLEPTGVNAHQDINKQE
eukprot:4036529-Ditylum_brightwellii.AAC.1